MKCVLLVNFFQIFLMWISVGEYVICRGWTCCFPFMFPPALKEEKEAVPSALSESVTSRVLGNYTCIVSNAYGKDEYTASLTVTGDKDIASNDPSDSIRMSSTGSLIIQKVEASMKGPYTCEAENGFGSPLKKNHSCLCACSSCVVERANGYASKEGDLVSIPCRATGVPQPTITWTTVK
ncbi:down syndrome cell adhesion molecule-like protein 1 [Caerostris extrusa]|uniref:Down syndrome cell adhesion molecule-like protein 1 n=1 Tax=Caerostris extrusa TaxID=172846 RepID=A0AAV4WXW1_CAEEX|nr:down syndrome cell adhesion molecule-like protein 1 [Caerostris extrusa]